ncbi:MAG: aminoglycoside phosphotransferase family protein, partial [Candidatus Eremiobacteraeota bacterium]|nr:aminoglycoside phosphotransferase family protein [Candidatus Eremiobacteraeota bacterium]
MRGSIEFVSLLTEEFGEVREALEMGHSSRVWRLKFSSGSTLYLKRFSQRRKFIQALRAYQEWTPQLSRTPRLMRVMDEALLLSEVPGRPLNEAAAPADYREAGAFLRRLHNLSYQDQDVALSVAYEQRLVAALERAEGRIEEALLVRIRQRLLEALPLMESYRRSPCHRDFTPGNWLRECTESPLHVIDFEHAQPDLFLMDFEPLVRGYWGRR